MRRPAVFISHGSPMVLLDEDEYTRALAALGQSEPAPRAVVVVSAHWQEPAPVRVTGGARPRQIFDFAGFPDALYTARYIPPGDPALAAGIASLLNENGIETVLDARRGLDHGAWVPLRFAYPVAEIPVVQVSLSTQAAPVDLMRIGRALAPLRGQDVLLIGSGGAVHNLRRVVFDRKDAPVDGWARLFDEWLAGRLRARDFDTLAAWHRAAPQPELAHPTSEHFDPLFVVLGAAGDGDRVTTIYEGFQYGNLSMRSFALKEE